MIFPVIFMKKVCCFFLISMHHPIYAPFSTDYTHILHISQFMSILYIPKFFHYRINGIVSLLSYRFASFSSCYSD